MHGSPAQPHGRLVPRPSAGRVVGTWAAEPPRHAVALRTPAASAPPRASPAGPWPHAAVLTGFGPRGHRRPRGIHDTSGHGPKPVGAAARPRSRSLESAVLAAQPPSLSAEPEGQLVSEPQSPASPPGRGSTVAAPPGTVCSGKSLRVLCQERSTRPGSFSRPVTASPEPPGPGRPGLTGHRRGLRRGRHGSVPTGWGTWRRGSTAHRVPVTITGGAQAPAEPPRGEVGYPRCPPLPTPVMAGPPDKLLSGKDTSAPIPPLSCARTLPSPSCGGGTRAPTPVLAVTRPAAGPRHPRIQDISRILGVSTRSAATGITLTHTG